MSAPRLSRRLQTFVRPVMADKGKPPRLRHDADCSIFLARKPRCSCGLLHALMPEESASELYPKFQADLDLQDAGLATRSEAP